MKILLATTNEKKIKEYNNLFKGIDVDFITLKDLNCDLEAPEEKDTFEGNAIQKAQFYYDLFKLPTISEDAGLEVFALDGFPGIYSKRWMDGSSYDIKVEQLLNKLEGKDSSCQYKAVIAFVNGNQIKTFEGTYEGKLTTPDKNNKDAFGYDLGFYVESENSLLSDLPLEFKNDVSHRAKALEKFLEWIKTSK